FVGPSPAEVEGTISLDPGYHGLRLEYFQEEGTALLALRYAPPLTAKALVPSSVLSTAGVSEVSALGELEELLYLSLANNAITHADALGSLSALEALDLSRNEIAKVGGLAGAAVIDDGDFARGYSESGAPWWRSIRLVPGVVAFQRDYRYSVAEALSVAAWTFTGLRQGPYELYATWHPHSGQASNAAYTVDGEGAPVEVEVNQKFAPAGLSLSGRTWEKLGTFQPDETGTLVVNLSDAGADGAVVADGVLALSVDVLLPELLELNLENNPLSNAAHDLLQKRAGDWGFSLRVDANSTPIWSASIGPQTPDSVGASGASMVYPDLDQLLSDPESEWLVVGTGDSAEVLRYRGPTDPAAGGFVEVLASVKQRGQTGNSSVTGGGYGLDGDLYVADLARHHVHRFNGASGKLLRVSTEGQSSNFLSPTDLAIGPDGDVYVTSLVRERVVRLNQGDLSADTVYNSAAPVVVTFPITMSLAFGADGDLYVSWYKLNGVTQLYEGAIRRFAPN
ncbi:MAG: hypothetical protein ACRDHY_11965, partial [Anaerolineales bacterium]